MGYLTSFDNAGFQNSIAHGQNIKANREAKKAEGEYRNVLGGMIGQGDYQGAAQAAAGSGRFEDADKLFEYMGTLDEKQSAAAQRRAKALAAVAQAVKGVPPEQRLAAVQQGQFAGLAEQFGLDVNTLTPESLSDQSLDRVTALAVGINDELYERTRDTRADFESDRDFTAAERKQDWAEEDGRFDNELSREKFGETVRSNKAGESIDRGNLKVRQDELVQKIAEATTTEGGVNFDDEQKIRKEFTSLTQDFQKVQGAYGRIQASAKDPSAAGDLALIFNYMKMLDPGSVVREGEFATAQNAAGVPTRARNLYNNLLTGERLAPAQRDDFLGQSQAIYAQAEGAHTQLEQRYRGIATASGLEPTRAVPDLRAGVNAVGGDSPVSGAPTNAPVSQDDPLGIRQ